MQCIIRAVAAETTAVFAESKFKVATLQVFYTQVLQSWVCNVFSKLKEELLKETQ